MPDVLEIHDRDAIGRHVQMAQDEWQRALADRSAPEHEKTAGEGRPIRDLSHVSSTPKASSDQPARNRATSRLEKYGKLAQRRRRASIMGANTRAAGDWPAARVGTHPPGLGLAFNRREVFWLLDLADRGVERPFTRAAARLSVRLRAAAEG
jgi:hypothetical protein